MVLLENSIVKNYSVEYTGGVPVALMIEGAPRCNRHGIKLTTEITDEAGKIWRGYATVESTGDDVTRFRLHMLPRDNYYAVSVRCGDRDALAADAAVEILTERYRHWLMAHMDIKTTSSGGNVRCVVDAPRRDEVRLEFELSEADLIKIIENC
jgi:hypothetical protein